MALPPPVYPIDVQPGQLVGRITIELFGRQHVVINLRQPGCIDGRRPRCDSYVADHEGELVAGGWSAIFRAVVARSWITRAMSRRAIATVSAIRQRRWSSGSRSQAWRYAARMSRVP